MTRSASHFCFVVFPPQSLLDVLESRVMKRTSISYCAVWDFAISAMANSTTQKRLTMWVVFYIFCKFHFPNHSHREWFPQGLLVVLESWMMKRTSISYCAVWENSRADILGSKTSQCEVLVCDARVQLHKNDSQCESFFTLYRAQKKQTSLPAHFILFSFW